VTEEEIRAAVLAALLEYDTLKKARRLKALKRALRGTMMATVISSTGLMAANQSRTAYVEQKIATLASNTKLAPQLKSPDSATHIVLGVAHFGLNQHALSVGHNERLIELTQQLPKDAELIVVGRADGLGGYRYNKKLANQRALSVAGYLVAKGFKIVAVTSKVAKPSEVSWLNRRVDIVLKHTSTDLAEIKLPPVLDLYLTEKPHTVMPAKAGLTAKSYLKPTMEQFLSQHLKKEFKNKWRKIPQSLLIAANSKVLAKASKGGQAKNPDSSIKNLRQKVAGVAHFAAHQHDLTIAHKERLDILLSQIPKAAKLMVVGRCDFADNFSGNKLAKQRALAVANYLACQGVNVVSVGIKPSSNRLEGWAARRVDVAVEHDSTKPLTINLPALVNRTELAQQKTKDNLVLDSSRKVKHYSKKMDGLMSRLAVDW
jgi:outer membrane protein OmpA-like peptidoglycan-associated protein